MFLVCRDIPQHEAWKTIENVKKDTRENAKLNLMKLEWENYYKALLTENRKEFEYQNINIESATNVEVNEITVPEIKQALQKLKN